MPPEVVYPPKPDPQYDYKKPAIVFNYERRMRFLYELRKWGLLYRAAEQVGVSTHQVSVWRKKEPEFDAACNEAKQRWIDDVLVAEATRRAVQGVDNPIIGGKFRDEVVGTERVYSDALLMFLMRSQRPEFREAPVHSGDSGAYNQEKGGVMIVPSAPKTMDEWEKDLGPQCRKPEPEEK